MQIALGVSGGIAAYKTPEIVRGLYKGGAEVRVLMTSGAERFVTPLTLQTLSGAPVVRDPWGLDAPETVRHIDLARTIDAFVVAPATANMLAKFAGGVADDLLSTFYVSVTAPVVVAPAMNTRMWLHPATCGHVDRLRGRGVRIVPPEDGWLAERETGVGRLADPATIVAEGLAAARRSRAWAGRKVVVSAGPTREPIDPVRYLSNRSTGRMGYALAEAAARRGAEAVLVSGPTDRPLPYGVRRVSVSTSREMRDAMHAERDGAWLVVMAAAVADYLPPYHERKVKKGEGPWNLELNRGPDILEEIGGDRKESILVGFAAETDDVEANARGKLERKGLDFIVANDVSDPTIGFGSKDNALVVLGRDGGRWAFPRASKRELAESLADLWSNAVHAEEGERA